MSNICRYRQTLPHAKNLLLQAPRVYKAKFGQYIGPLQFVRTEIQYQAQPSIPSLNLTLKKLLSITIHPLELDTSKFSGGCKCVIVQHYISKNIQLTWTLDYVMPNIHSQLSDHLDYQRWEGNKIIIFKVSKYFKLFLVQFLLDKAKILFM